MTLETVALTPRIGTEVRTDVATLVKGDHAEEIIELLEQRGVLLFRELNIAREDQLLFAKTLGQLQLQFSDEGIFKISLDPNENIGAEYLKGSFFWHIDGASDDVPNFAAMLNAQVLSDTGGTTYFANTYAAYDDLPDEDKAKYDKMRVVHSFETSQRFVNPEPGGKELTFWQSRTPKIHPLVWNHKSGRKSLVLGSTADHIEGMDRAEGRLILAKLREWATQPQFVLSHDWTVGDLIVWDNSGTMHRVDAYPLDSGRMLYRSTIESREALV